MLAPVRNEAADLLPFEEVRRALRLGSQTYQGVQEVPLSQIVGSVARYHDFNRAFLPRREQMRERWRRVDQLTMRKPLDPIEVYKVDEVYLCSTAITGSR